MCVRKKNKAFSATLNRLIERYRGHHDGYIFDVVTNDFCVSIENTATIKEAITRLIQCQCAVYVAMTNSDGVREALRDTARTRIGVMDPRGEILKPATVY